MVVRTRHVFMCRKEQPTDMHGFLVVFILLSVEKKNAIFIFFLQLRTAINSKYSASLLKTQLNITLGLSPM